MWCWPTRQFCSHSSGESALAASQFQAKSEDDTDRLGQAVAGILQAGDVVTLNGELGAGKTRLVRAIVTSLTGDSQLVNSPTFVLIQQYPAAIPIYHMDAYRLSNEDEFLALGAEEILEGDGVCLIEWAERIAGVLPADHLRIDIISTGEYTRQFRISGTGSRSIQMVNQLRLLLNDDSE
ncbi:MAG: tRNA (adenosine(37)-N6)-threonylcarbamoyltransferase complex ATPase subunit type 1 TsaE [Planctomycetaceae bacterium]|nr:tRNA (adenosine(37)-N6)-threonylcarbamoyltransferase complex ATPase subunit type 1 TsaE [Planctomycetaceae bacterium]